MKLKNLKKNQKVGLIAAAGTLLIFALGTTIALVAQRRPTVGFYNVPASVFDSIQHTMGKHAAYKAYSTSQPLSAVLAQGAKPDLLVVPSGQALSDATAAASAKVVLQSELLKATTSSIRSMVQEDRDRQAVALPLLSSHFEIAVNTQLLKKTSVKSLSTWSDIERFAQEAAEKYNAKLLFAGKDSNTFFDLLGALTESISGRRQYDNAVQRIEIALDKASSSKKAEFNAAQLAQTLAALPDSPLHDAIRLLNRCFKEGLIFTEVFSLDTGAVATLMKTKSACVVFMLLDEHRALEHSVGEKYASYYLPSSIPPVSRTFTAPVYFAVPMKNNKKLVSAFKQLLQPGKQELLCRETGLAPVLTDCRTVDNQAEEARHWIAATNAPLAGLSRETPLSQAQKDALAEELSVLVRFGSF